MPDEWLKSWVMPVFKGIKDVLDWELSVYQAGESYIKVVEEVFEAWLSRTYIRGKSVWVHTGEVHNGADICNTTGYGR